MTKWKIGDVVHFHLGQQDSGWIGRVIDVYTNEKGDRIAKVMFIKNAAANQGPDTIFDTENLLKVTEGALKKAKQNYARRVSERIRSV